MKMIIPGQPMTVVVC